MARENLRVSTGKIDGNNVKEVDLEPDMGLQIYLPDGNILTIGVRREECLSNDCMVSIRAKDGMIGLRPSCSNEIFVGITGSVSDIRRRHEMKALSKARLWEHHRDCEPLSKKGCECGLWDAQEAAKIYEAKKKHGDSD